VDCSSIRGELLVEGSVNPSRESGISPLRLFANARIQCANPTNEANEANSEANEDVRMASVPLIHAVISWSGRHFTEEAELEPKKVLVVDDAKLLHRMYDVILRKYALVHAYDGRDALRQLAEQPGIDLILLDINMPQMNGLELLGHLKADPHHARIPVIIVSTEGKDTDTARGLQAGAAAYVTKPFTNDSILDVIARLGADTTA
jgi:two-component system chemotaxis response regulator CheY